MATIRYKNVGIRAMAACVPSEVYENKNLGYLIPEADVEKTIESIGIRERRVAPDGVCASDLCFQAARQLLDDNDIAPDSIDVLLFMSQTPDYRIPATAPLLQHRLGLSKRTACMDLNLACSGYVYALSAAFAYASMAGVDRVLLLDGNTMTRLVNRRDKVDWPLYGDAGTATLIEKGNYPEATFALYSDGEGENAVKIEAGMRKPITLDSFREHECADGSFCNDMQIHMDGMGVFNFAMSVVPKGVKEMMTLTGCTLDEVDYLLFHQANKFMTNFFTKKLKFNPEKVPYSIERFGNTSSTSIPLTIVSELERKLKEGDKLVMCGFGAGLSWGTALISWGDCKISPLTEY